ncbi:hypothetical protein M434DRAFT_282919 [Hypoxylon sp. CO27-5]|nr:hypothetical protein M434DRAFT_282919 [Hypoxylon sp. CO27-5]
MLYRMASMLPSRADKVVYLDDILSHSKTYRSHVACIEMAELNASKSSCTRLGVFQEYMFLGD